MKLNQFAVYRVDQQTAGKALWHVSISCFIRGIYITIIAGANDKNRGR